MDRFPARSGRRHPRLLALVAGATLVGAAVAVPLVYAGPHGRGRAARSSDTRVATVTAYPSDHLASGQAVEVTVTGFGPDQKVGITQCPRLRRVDGGAPCAPLLDVLTTDGSGAARGVFTVRNPPLAFSAVFGDMRCLPRCLLVASSLSPTGVPLVTVTTGLTFASLPPPPPPVNSPEPPGFGTFAASFIDPAIGWALGSTGCPGCAGIARTQDGGTTWTYLPAPPTKLWWYSDQAAAVTDIYFANASDGYIFGPGLYLTTDGGHSWTDEHLNGVRAIIVAGTYVYALTGFDDSGPELLYRSQLATSTWRRLTLPGVPGQERSFQMAAAGPNLVLLGTGASDAGITAAQVGRIWISTDRGADWQPRDMPCTVADGGASVVSVAYGHPQAWLIDCYDNEQSSQEQNTLQHIYGTADGGRRWVRLGDPPQHGAPALLADNGTGHAFLATVGGFADTLNATLDGGRAWSVDIADSGPSSGWVDLRFISTATGFVVGYAVGPTHGTPGRLYRTTDGGVSWEPLTVSPTHR